MFGLANLRTGYWWDSGIAKAAHDGFPNLTFLRRVLYLLPHIFLTQALLLYEWVARYPGPWARYWYISDGGFFKPGSRALIIGRYSTCCTETRRGRYRSLALAGKLYPTADPEHPAPLRTANFITQEDLGGAKSRLCLKGRLERVGEWTIEG